MSMLGNSCIPATLFSRTGISVLALSPDQYQDNIKFLHDIEFMQPQVTNYSTESTRILNSFLDLGIKRFQRSLTIVFSVSIPVLFICYLILRPLEKRIREENARTMKMLLMIPMEVIDTVPAIKEYLEMGVRKNSQQKWKGVLEETLARNRAILEASVDAIVVINSTGIIELFNTGYLLSLSTYLAACERMLGYAAHEVLGQNVSILMDDATAANHTKYIAHYLVTKTSKVIGTVRELRAKKKDGTFIPIQISLSEAHVTGKTLFAGNRHDVI